MLKIKRVLISVSDKSGLIDFAKQLQKYKVEIISTGGTAKVLSAAGIKVTPLTEVTGFPEVLDGRVKTLHPNVHAAILARRDKPSHMKQLKQLGIKPIDMLVVNLYPFEQVTKNKKVKLDDAIENVDIGGVALLRAAAKNYQGITVVPCFYRYADILNEMKKNKCSISEKMRKHLAVEAFASTASYDAAISGYFSQKFQLNVSERKLERDQITLSFKKVRNLRYGENPHQKAAFYQNLYANEYGVGSARWLHGKELSYNNIMDLDAAFSIATAFKKPAVSVIKHANPCGVATASTLVQAFKDAHACDPLSAFGGIVGLNKKVDVKTAQAILKAGFLECIIAPAYEEKAIELLKTKKNLRLLQLPLSLKAPVDFHLRKVKGGILIQEFDQKQVKKSQIKIATKKKPTTAQLDALLFAWTVGKYVNSNAIVLAKGTKTVGIGAGQMSRVDSVMIACKKAGSRSKGAILASDGFFPKADNIVEAKKAGITAIIQPGGSIRDQEVIDEANKQKIAMVFTGMRHFKH